MRTAYRLPLIPLLPPGEGGVRAAKGLKRAGQQLYTQHSALYFRHDIGGEAFDDREQALQGFVFKLRGTVEGI